MKLLYSQSLFPKLFSQQTYFPVIISCTQKSYMPVVFREQQKDANTWRPQIEDKVLEIHFSKGFSVYLEL